MMTGHEIVELVRLVVVLALVVGAAALATPKGRLPLALRGLQRIVRRDHGLASVPNGGAVESVSRGRRLGAFLLILIAAALALIIL